MTVKLEASINRYIGDTGDTKPTGVPVGSTYLDRETSILYTTYDGTNWVAKSAIAKLAANSGVDIGDVDVTSIVPGAGATNIGKAEDAVHSSGDVGVMALGVQKATAAALGAEGDYEPLQVDASGRLWTAPLPGVDIGDVDIASIAAGDNNIGNVDLVTLPAGNLGQQAVAASLSVAPATNIADATYIGDVKFGEALIAGDNNIGNVDIATIAAGDNNIGNVDIASIAAGANNIGDVDEAAIAAASGDVHAPAANTAAVVTYTADASNKHVVTGIAWSYAGGIPTGGNLKVEDVSGTTVCSLDITEEGPGIIVFPKPKKGAAVNTAMIVTLAAGGAGITGKVSVLNHYVEP